MKKKDKQKRFRQTVTSGMFCFLLALSGLFLFAQKSKKPSPPNIVYILADDMGYGDISANNPGSKIRTKHIDRLAKQGMRFTDVHTTSSVCTPSRYSILTGRYPWRSRLPVGVLRGYSRTLIEEGRSTVANLLKEANYHTGVVGKWHLGLDWVPKDAFKDSLSNEMYGISREMNPDQIDFTRAPVRGPLTQGFDYSYILPASLDMPPYSYLENDMLTELPTASTPGNKLTTGYTGPFWRAGLMGPSFDFYDVLPTFTQKATEFIKRQSGNKNPFFLYFPMPAPHTPWVPTNEFTGKSGAGEYGDYSLMVDDAVGKILKVLDSMGFSKNTMVIFTSDNGPYWRQDFVEKFQHKSAGEYRGMKGDAFEGGHRVPFIVRYPGKVKPGTTTDVTTTLANLVATCSDLLGNHAPALQPEDSYSILPVLTGKVTRIKEQPAVIHSSSIGFYAIRKGPWKLITSLGSGGFSVPKEIQPKAGEPTGQLYNLHTDIHEDRNVYNQYPDKVKELTELLQKIKHSKTRLIQDPK